MAAQADAKSKKILLTSEGFAKLEAEVEDLKTRGRREVAGRLKAAIEFGDLSENAEYDEAKNQQAFLEQRINQIEEQLKNVEIVAGASADVVQIGSTVTIERKVDGEKHEYTIVGSTETDPLAHKISNESPVGEAIMGKKKGDTVKVKAPGGEFEYKVVKVG